MGHADTSTVSTALSTHLLLSYTTHPCCWSSVLQESVPHTHLTMNAAFTPIYFLESAKILNELKLFSTTKTFTFSLAQCHQIQPNTPQKYNWHDLEWESCEMQEYLNEVLEDAQHQPSWSRKKTSSRVMLSRNKEISWGSDSCSWILGPWKYAEVRVLLPGNPRKQTGNLLRITGYDLQDGNVS